MTTVVDALVVTLGLDASKFIKSQKQVLAASKQTKEQLAKEGKETELAAKAMVDGIEKLGKSLLSLFTIFTGGKALENFVTDITKSDAALGRTAKTVGMSTNHLAALELIVQRAGGTAGEASKQLQSLSAAFADLQTKGKYDERFNAFSRASVWGARVPFPRLLH